MSVSQTIIAATLGILAMGAGAPGTVGAQQSGAVGASGAGTVGVEQSAAVRRDVAELVAVLNDPAAPQTRRDEAARRLVSRRNDEAARAVGVALTDLNNRGGQLAAARALAQDDSGAAVTLVAPLHALLGTDRQLTEAAAEAMARVHGPAPQVVPLLLAFAEARQRPEGPRAAVVRALGWVVEKRVAASLARTLADETEPRTVRDAAARALGDLTGRDDLADDPAAWARWWETHAQTPEAEFRSAALSARSARWKSLRQRVDQLQRELPELLSDAYRLIPEAQRTDKLLLLLRSSVPEVRAAGARLIYDDALEARAVAPGARELLRQLLGDSSPEVRLAAASAVRVLNDAGAFPALLAQLGQEGEPDVRAAIAAALGPIRDVRAVPPLLELLDDPYTRVAESAAESLASLGPQLRGDPPSADRVAAEILAALAASSGRSGAEGFRAAALEALRPLRRREALPVASGLLASGDARVRRAALRLMGELREPDTAGVILTALNDAPDDAGVRLEAVAALGAIPTFDHAETLLRRTRPDVEPEPAVRERAWEAVVALLPTATREQLESLSARLAETPERRLPVQQALAARLSAPGDEAARAAARSELGAVLLTLGRATDAVEPLREAWKHCQTTLRPEEPDPLARLTAGRLVEALLRSGTFPQAVEAISQALSLDPSLRADLADRLLGEARRLTEDGDAVALSALLDAASTIRPVLDPEDLLTLQALLQRLRPTTAPTTLSAIPAPPTTDPTTRGTTPPPTTLPTTRP